jgi:hypothetical protein
VENVRRFLRSHPSEPLSVSRTDKFGRVVLLRNADATVEQFRLSTHPKYQLVYNARAEGTDILRGIEPSQQVTLDAASLVRVAAALGLATYKDYALECVIASDQRYRDAYDRAASGDPRVLVARRYVLDGIGALLVMREMGYRPARELFDTEQPLTLHNTHHTKASTLMDIAVRTNRVTAEYIKQFVPGLRPTGPARSARHEESERHAPENAEDRAFIVPDDVED